MSIAFRSFSGLFLTLIVSMSATGCTELSRTVTPPESERAAVPQNSAAMQLASALAAALNDSRVRHQLNESFLTSDVKEGKLHFQSYLRKSTQDLLSAMATHSSFSEEQLLNLLEKVPSLEFYLPVDSHRDKWRGSAEVLVAARLQEDRNPAGFTLAGKRIDLDRTIPPSIPTIALVPAESFGPDGRPVGNVQNASNDLPTRGADCLKECDDGGSSGGGGVDWSTKDPGIYMIENQISDLGEGWPNGDPELELHTYIHDPDVDKGVFRACSSEFNSDYNQDNNVWEGAVLAAKPSDIDAAPEDEGVFFVIMEDDDEFCKNKFQLKEVDLYELLKALDYEVEGWDGYDDCSGALCRALALIKSLVGTFNQSDDFVGLIVEETCDAGGITYEHALYQHKDGSKNGCVALHLHQ